MRALLGRLARLGPWLYLVGLADWLVVHLLTGDRLVAVAMVAVLAPLLFLPAPFVLLHAAWRRRWWQAALAAALVAWWLAGWGALFLPRWSVAPSHRPLRVLTYNVDADHADVAALLATIRDADADLVALQELRDDVAPLLVEALSAEYPHRWIEARDDGYQGYGMLSRYPLFPVGAATGDYWIATPQVAHVEVAGERVLWLNLHSWPTKPETLHPFWFAREFESSYRSREEAFRVLARWLAGRTEPVILSGDLNCTDRSDARAILLDAGLTDAWRERGRGLGMTYRSRIGRWPWPPFLRIDYVLTRGVGIVSAERLGWDGVSDHRALVVELALEGE